MILLQLATSTVLCSKNKKIQLNQSTALVAGCSRIAVVWMSLTLENIQLNQEARRHHNILALTNIDLFSEIEHSDWLVQVTWLVLTNYLLDCISATCLRGWLYASNKFYRTFWSKFWFAVNNWTNQLIFSCNKLGWEAFFSKHFCANFQMVKIGMNKMFINGKSNKMSRSPLTCVCQI